MALFCVWIAKSRLRNEKPWATQNGSHVIHTMASEWVTNTQYLDIVVTVDSHRGWFTICAKRTWRYLETNNRRREKLEMIHIFLFGCSQSVWSKRSNENKKCFPHTLKRSIFLWVNACACGCVRKNLYELKNISGQQGEAGNIAERQGNVFVRLCVLDREIKREGSERWEGKAEREAHVQMPRAARA